MRVVPTTGKPPMSFQSSLQLCLNHRHLRRNLVAGHHARIMSPSWFRLSMGLNPKSSRVPPVQRRNLTRFWPFPSRSIQWSLQAVLASQIPNGHRELSLLTQHRHRRKGVSSRVMVPLISNLILRAARDHHTHLRRRNSFRSLTLTATRDHCIHLRGRSFFRRRLQILSPTTVPL